MAIRSRQIVSRGTLTVGAWTDVYTVPQDRTLILKACVVTNTTSVAREVHVGVRSATTNIRVRSALALAAGGTLDGVLDELVLNPGSVLAVFLGSEGTSNLVHVYASGSLLEGVPA